ncbi:hypothetical protein ACQCVH_11815 [Bacillus infantis]
MGRILKKIYCYSALMKKAGIISEEEYQKIIEGCCGQKRSGG